ncbi:hypothetical protein [Saccharopolyspora sp. ASAGF58]|uniref:hypothetical protein n=1 Tax=Saccharopolyspora sp. ASAGF58 TaxID=2719023 RepID=UPI00143FCEC5|nr:hypothetical protein [Saccharopolyspora sp. ASAGF58]QIZ36391.1 hypothetical protein FDZ84_19070 [Saccharopolyspora sp. ASAGF58]
MPPVSVPDRRNVLAGERIVDAGYTSAEPMISAQRDFDITLLSPLRVGIPHRTAPRAVSTAPPSPGTTRTSHLAILDLTLAA